MGEAGIERGNVNACPDNQLQKAGSSDSAPHSAPEALSGDSAGLPAIQQTPAETVKAAMIRLWPGLPADVQAAIMARIREAAGNNAETE